MITKGSKVKLRPDVLRRHAKSVPAHAGYTSEQFSWRKTLDNLEGKTGIVERTFPSSKHINVRFGKTLIGINNSEVIEKPKTISLTQKGKKGWKSESARHALARKGIKTGTKKKRKPYIFPSDDLEEYFLGKDPRKTKYYKERVYR